MSKCSNCDYDNPSKVWTGIEAVPVNKKNRILKLGDSLYRYKQGKFTGLYIVGKIVMNDKNAVITVCNEGTGLYIYSEVRLPIVNTSIFRKAHPFGIFYCYPNGDLIDVS